VKNVLALSVILLAVCGTRLLWQLHPWVKPGTALRLGNWQIGQFEFQVWQRKNPWAWEPFADGLFVRQGTNDWQVFCFDIQDNYSPKVKLRKVGSKVHVMRDGEDRGVFDLVEGSFRARSNTPAYTPVVIGNATDPPGRWWLR